MPTEGVAAVTAYTVRAIRWERGWELHIDGVGVTQSHGLADAERMVRSYLRMTDAKDAEDAEITLHPEIEGGLDREAAKVRAELGRIEADQARAAANSRAIARRLREAGLSGADTAVVMGISPQRVSQLVRG
jgi:hypothetical protein